MNEELKKEIISKTFGSYYAMVEVAKGLDLTSQLHRTYGERNGNILLGTAISRIVHVGPPTQTADVFSESFLPELLNFTDDTTWEPLESGILFLEMSYAKRDDLFKNLSEGDSSIVFELTSFLTPFKLLDLNKAGLKYGIIDLPLRTVYLATNMQDGRPFAFFYRSPREPSISSMRFIDKEVGKYGKTTTEFFSDGSCITEEGMVAMGRQDLGYTIRIGPESKIYKRLLSESVRPLHDSTQTHVQNGMVYRVYETEGITNDGRSRAIILLNEKRRNDELLSFYEKIGIFERTVPEMDWSDDIEDTVSMEQEFEDIARMFSFKPGKDGKVEVTRKRKAITAEENKFGKSIFITNTSRTWQEIVRMKQVRDIYEHDLTVFKTDLERGARYFPSAKSAESSFISDFVGIILKSRLQSLIESSPFAGRVEVEGILSELNKLKVSKIDGEWMVNTIPFSQMAIFSALGVDIPYRVFNAGM